MPQSETRYFRELSEQLSILYEDTASARRVAQQAGLTLSHIKLEGKMLDVWAGIVAEARKNNRGLLRLAQVVMLDYAENPEMMRLLARMPETDSVGLGMAEIRDELRQVREEVGEMRTEIGGLREDFSDMRADQDTLKKSVLNSVMEWAISRQI